MKTWHNLAQTADRVDTRITRTASTATILDTDAVQTPLVEISAASGLDDRARDRVLRAAVNAVLIELRRSGA